MYRAGREYSNQVWMGDCRGFVHPGCTIEALGRNKCSRLTARHPRARGSRRVRGEGTS